MAAGFRKRNVLDLKWEQINLQQKTAWIYPDKTKAGRIIGITLNQTMVGVLEKQMGKHPSFVLPIRTAIKLCWLK
ncbi:MULTISPECIES: tyrosine-type recombinase/integrase [unclassified Neisseria]|uniref:tyrosine-type recombinase/integrase n=1 Tax=unclassified Neisseria TaxID=2623750 RepID=UPI001D1673C4|nr:MULTISPECIES: tyrosine-type recombinase/integrase [unclassified Neisseria]